MRTVGSGNVGATNVLRTGNIKIAAATLFLDGIKGVIPVILAMHWGKYDSYFPYLCALSAVIGHVFPVWLKFKGGKGVATALGVLLPLHPLLCMGVSATWLIAAKSLRISSLSALIAFILAPFYAFFLAHDPFLVSFSTVLACLLFYTHRTNIHRLIRGEEKRF